jgi:hypothetical protein
VTRSLRWYSNQSAVFVLRVFAFQVVDGLGLKALRIYIELYFFLSELFGYTFVCCCGDSENRWWPCSLQTLPIFQQSFPAIATLQNKYPRYTQEVITMIRMVFEIVMVLAVLAAIFFMNKMLTYENKQKDDEVQDDSETS